MPFPAPIDLIIAFRLGIIYLGITIGRLLKFFNQNLRIYVRSALYA